MIVLHKTFSLILSAAVVTVPCVQGQQTPKQPPPAQLAPKTVPDQVQLFIPYKQYSREDNNRILKLYEPLRVSDVSDGMDVIGLQDIGIADEAIQPLWRDTVNFTHRIVGIAVTARYVPTNKRPAKIPPEEVDNWYANITGEPFMGQHGYSLTLEGKEKGWNDNALHRRIIMHPADYVSEEHIRQWGYLGRSEGCPAIPEDLDKSIIDSISGGSCLFIYGPDIRYLYRSRLAAS